jgi:hypothetical protein
MVTSAQLPKPGVKVIQKLRTVTPTVLSPSLVPVIIGAAKQTLELLKVSATGARTLNNDANVLLPATLVALPAPSGLHGYVYTGLDGKVLNIGVNGVTLATVTFSDTTSYSLTPATVVSQVNAALVAAGVTSLVAFTHSDHQWAISTLERGDFAEIEIEAGTDTEVTAAFGFVIDQPVFGFSLYHQYSLNVPQLSFPDPNNNLSQLSIESSTIRVFFGISASNVLEARTDAAVLRFGEVNSAAATAAGSVNLTTTYPTTLPGKTIILSVDGTQQTYTFGTAASVTGNVNLVDTPTLPTNETLNFTVDALAPVAFTFSSETPLSAIVSAINLAAGGITVASIGGVGNKFLVMSSVTTGSTSRIQITGGSALALLGLTVTDVYGTGLPVPANQSALLSALNNATTGFTGVTASVGGSNGLVFTHDTGGNEHSIVVGAGTANAALGIAEATYNGVSISAVDDGDGNAVTSILDFPGYDFTLTVATAAVLESSTALGTVLDSTTLIVSDGQAPRTVTFQSAGTIGAVVTQINAVCGAAVGGRLVASNSSGKLKLTSLDLGIDGRITILGGTALATLDPGGTPTLIAGASVYGDAAAPVAGDEVWVDGVLLGTVTKVAPGGDASRLKINQYVTISTNVGTHFFIVAKKLTNTTSTSTRPCPELVVNLDGSIYIKFDAVRDFTGAPVAGAVPLYITYRALRLDYSPRAQSPGLIKLQGASAVIANMQPITTENPLGLGMYFAALNAPGIQIDGIGVTEISDAEPYGTLNGFQEAVDYLKAFEVYALAPLTHDTQNVGLIMHTHVTEMSAPEKRGERILLMSPEMPTRAADRLVSSGNGDATTSTSFDTKVPNIPTFIQAAGISPVGTIPTSEGLFLEIDGDSKKYSISSVASGIIYIRTSFATGENDDSFYSTTALTLPIIGALFSVKVRGAALVTPTGLFDKDAAATAISTIAAGFNDRRVWLVWPNQVKTTILGVEQLIESFYAVAGIAGMIGQYSPSQSFTNYPMVGMSGVVNSTDFFTSEQLDMMAANGVYILYQEGEGAAVVSRMALTTDPSSIESRTDIVTKVLDYTAKTLRQTLRSFMGLYNISQGFIDSLNTVIEAVGAKLIEQRILNDFQPGQITQDLTETDQLLVEITVAPPIPCNYLSITLVV